MSNNPWPFVVVALLSLGFLANSMAQQEDAGNAYSPGSTAGQDFGADSSRQFTVGLPEFDPQGGTTQKDKEDQPNRWITNGGPSASQPDPTNAISEQDTVAVRAATLGAATGRDSSPFTANTSTGPASNVNSPNFRTPNTDINDATSRVSNGQVARLLPADTVVASVPETDQPSVQFGNVRSALPDGSRFYGNQEIDSQNNEDRSPFSVAQIIPSTPETLTDSTTEEVPYWNQTGTSPGNDAPYRVRGTSPTDPPTKLPRRSILRRDTAPEDVQLVDDAPPEIQGSMPTYPSRGRRNVETHETALVSDETPFIRTPPPFGDARGRTNQDTSTRPIGNEAGRGENSTSPTDKSEAGGGVGLGKFFESVSNGIIGSTDANTEDLSQGATPKLPLWPTMALFASLAANLFFGWIAWDTHSKYQTFVEEISEAESDRDRRSRRLRDEPRPSVTARRRSREEDEADFLNGGIEV